VQHSGFHPGGANVPVSKPVRVTYEVNLKLCKRKVQEIAAEATRVFRY